MLILIYFLFFNFLSSFQNYKMDTCSTTKSWVKYDNQTHFPLQNIPFGVCRTTQGRTICCSRIGDYIIDLASLEEKGLLNTDYFQFNQNSPVFNRTVLNNFIALGRQSTNSVRQRLIQLFSDSFSESSSLQQFLIPVSDVTMQLPMQIGDYTDFYSSLNHAFNMGCILRGPDNALQPNWKHLPVAYHGRASTVVVSGTKIVRPSGQINPTNKDPSFSECKRLDFEVEIGAVVGRNSEIGKPVKVSEAGEYVFGYVLLNDWSARDIQGWEYIPLGPFTAKNFASTISPWIVTSEALLPFRVSLPEQVPRPLPYLFQENLSSYDLNIQVNIRPQNEGKTFRLAETNYKYMYWTVDQQVAHHTVTGCNLQVGDLLGSGTISGKTPESYGSLFELTSNGKTPITLESNLTRTYIQDNDSIIMTGYCVGEGYLVGFGECEGTILPALPESYFK